MGKILDPSFYRYGPPIRPLAASITQEFGHHTLIHLDYEVSTKADYVLPEEDSPFAVRIGQDSTNTRTTYGYVNHYESVNDKQTSANLRLVGLGTSKRMNKTEPTTWTEMTSSAIVREYAKRYKLRSIINTHPYVENVWASGDRTDFQSLQALADGIGYRVWVDGATVFLLDPQKLLLSAQTLDTPHFQGVGIRALKIVGGLNAPRDSGPIRRSVVYGLDTVSNEFLQATGGDESLPDRVEQTTASSASEAEKMADAAQRKSLDYYTASLTVVGNARIAPGTLISLGGNRVTTDQEGTWMVHKTRHRFMPREYLTDIVAVRGVDQQPTGRFPATVRGTTQYVGAVIRDGSNWEAQLQEHVNA